MVALVFREITPLQLSAIYQKTNQYTRVLIPNHIWMFASISFSPTLDLYVYALFRC